MRTLFFCSILFINILSPLAQSTVNGSMVHNGITRTYSVYLPAAYTGANAVPVVFNLHGYTSNAQQQSLYGNFTAIADTANFIVVHPNGTIQPGTSNTQFWNVGFFASTVDDVDFLETLLDELIATYNINETRVYSTGMSNGGYMSYLLACQSSRFAAIASVTGSMTTTTLNGCSPTKPTPVMEIHGTADGTVPYNGTAGSSSIADVLNYWTTFNNCPATPTISQVPDLVLSDMASAEHWVYAAGTNGVTMEHFKVVSGGHTWPGAPFNIGVTCMDFSASKEIWRFFSQFENPLVSTAELNTAASMPIYPNPSNGTINFPGMKNQMVWITDVQGRPFSGTIENSMLNLNHLPNGVYLLHTAGKVERVVIER
jgi:polyhydroxybutyrate depolymerase